MHPPATRESVADALRAFRRSEHEDCGLRRAAVAIGRPSSARAGGISSRRSWIQLPFGIARDAWPITTL